MNIRFSRHSKRRMQLYGLSEDIIINVIKNGDKSMYNGKIFYLLKANGNKFPIKIVTVEKNDYIFVITTYPLKRVKNENKL